MALTLFRRTPVQAEMSFVGHLEALRWHIVRSVLAVIVLSVFAFMKIDWIFENVIVGPLKQDFLSVAGLCKLSHFLHMGDTLCLPAANVQLQTTAFGSLIYFEYHHCLCLWVYHCFSLYILGVVAVYKARTFTQRNKKHPGFNIFCHLFFPAGYFLRLFPAGTFYI